MVFDQDHTLLAKLQEKERELERLQRLLQEHNISGTNETKEALSSSSQPLKQSVPQNQALNIPQPLQESEEVPPPPDDEDEPPPPPPDDSSNDTRPALSRMLRTASNLHSEGLVTGETKGKLKNLILSSEETTQSSTNSARSRRPSLQNLEVSFNCLFYLNCSLFQ